MLAAMKSRIRVLFEFFLVLEYFRAAGERAWYSMFGPAMIC
jgi:hypothetical protein